MFNCLCKKKKKWKEIFWENFLCFMLYAPKKSVTTMDLMGFLASWVVGKYNKNKFLFLPKIYLTFVVFIFFIINYLLLLFTFSLTFTIFCFA